MPIPDVPSVNLFYPGVIIQCFPVAHIELFLPSCLILWGGVKLVVAFRDLGRVPCPDQISACIKANTGDIQRRELVNSSTQTLKILERSGSQVPRSPGLQTPKSPVPQVPIAPVSQVFTLPSPQVPKPPSPQAPKFPGPQVIRLQGPQVPERTLQLLYSSTRCCSPLYLCSPGEAGTDTGLRLLC